MGSSDIGPDAADHARRGARAVRPATPADAGGLTGLAMRSKAHWGYADDFMDACREELTYDADYVAAHEVFVVASGERVVGFCSLERVDEDRIELGGLFVEPAFIGTGMGRALMDRALAAARDAGARVMVIHGDPHAAGFYAACGAVEVGRVPSASIPGRSLPLYEIDLDGTA